ncbi:MAG: CRISPR-associated endoribonuclease Cas6, partial [Atribacterota bacterium]|nr:CRISPR-associated endoribonuclease Cas6 [Atribacterota bacterium]
MRVRLTFVSEKEQKLFLPLHYNHLIQALIYRILPEGLARDLHGEGFSYEKRHFKLFTFSRLLEQGQSVAQSGRRMLSFPGRISFFFATPRDEILESLLREAFTKKLIAILGQDVFLTEVHIMPEPKWSSPLTLRLLSPVTVYRTVEENGRRITHFLSPREQEFNRLLVENARKKYFLVTGKTAEKLSFSLEPFRFSERRNRVVVLFKGTPVAAWTGIFHLRGDPELIAVVYQAGLGSKNSAGFGMWEVWKL